MAAPRTRRYWPLAAAALLVLALAGVALVAAGRRGGDAAADRGRTRVTHDVVVQRVQSVAKLVASETTVRDVVVYENSWLGSTKRSLVVVTGKVLAGIDLTAGAGADVQIDDRARRIAVVLPPAEVLGVEIVNLRTYDERAGLWNPFRPADRDAILQRVRDQLTQASTEMGAIEQANRSAKAMLEALLATEGYAVDVQFRSRPIVPAAR